MNNWEKIKRETFEKRDDLWGYYYTALGRIQFHRKKKNLVNEDDKLLTKLDKIITNLLPGELKKAQIRNYSCTSAKLNLSIRLICVGPDKKFHTHKYITGLIDHEIEQNIFRELNKLGTIEHIYLDQGWNCFTQEIYFIPDKFLCAENGIYKLTEKQKSPSEPKKPVSKPVKTEEAKEGEEGQLRDVIKRYENSESETFCINVWRGRNKVLKDFFKLERVEDLIKEVENGFKVWKTTKNGRSVTFQLAF